MFLYLTILCCNFQGTDLSESPICHKHIAYQTSTDPGNAVDMGSLPRVVLQLRSFSAQVHSLLQSHDGSLPLARYRADSLLVARMNLSEGIVISVIALFAKCHAFSVAGPNTWNTLPEGVTSSQSEYNFRCQLKTWPFKKSFPDIII